MQNYNNMCDNLSKSIIKMHILSYELYKNFDFVFTKNVKNDIYNLTI